MDLRCRRSTGSTDRSTSPETEAGPPPCGFEHVRYRRPFPGPVSKPIPEPATYPGRSAWCAAESPLGAPYSAIRRLRARKHPQTRYANLRVAERVLRRGKSAVQCECPLSADLRPLLVQEPKYRAPSPTAAYDPKRKISSKPSLTAIRPKQKYTAARGRTGVGHDRDLNLGATLQPLRSRQLVEQHLRFLQIGGVEPLGEPAVYWGKQIAGSSNEGAARAAAAGADSWGRRRAVTASRWSSLGSSEPKHGVCSAVPPPSGALIAYSR